MTAEILPFPVAAPPVEPGPSPALSPGDIVVCCVNPVLGLWCAWPVDVVDDDGVVIAVRSPAGKRLGIDRLNCDPIVYGFQARDHEPAAFAGLRWKVWTDPAVAVLAFAAVGIGGGP